jgi:hypothetical protein
MLGAAAMAQVATGQVATTWQVAMRRSAVTGPAAAGMPMAMRMEVPDGRGCHL